LDQCEENFTQNVSFGSSLVANEISYVVIYVSTTWYLFVKQDCPF